MKAIELLAFTKALMFEKSSSKDYENYYLDNLNSLLVENFQLNNDILRSKGLKELSEIPLVKNGDDLIKYETELCYNVLPLGLASKLFMDDDLNKRHLFYIDYTNAKAAFSPCISVPVKDVF